MVQIIQHKNKSTLVHGSFRIKCTKKIIFNTMLSQIFMISGI